MNFKDYIDTFPKGSRYAEMERIAEALSMTAGAVYHWYAQFRNIKATRVFALEKITSGALCRHSLRPDVYGEKSSS